MQLLVNARVIVIVCLVRRMYNNVMWSNCNVIYGFKSRKFFGLNTQKKKIVTSQ